MSGMVTMRARKLRMYQLGMPRWSIGWRPTSAGIRTLFHGCASSPRSNVFRFVPRTPGCWHSWVQVFPVPLEKKSWVLLSELYLFLFSDSCSLSGTGTGDGTLLQIGVPQSHSFIHSLIHLVLCTVSKWVTNEGMNIHSFFRSFLCAV